MYIILDIIVIRIYIIYIVHKNCIILHFYTSCHIKEKCVEFFIFVIFFFFAKKTWLLYVTSNNYFLNFSQLKQNKEYV